MTDRSIALLLPGQGAQHAGMGVELYERETAFAAVVDDFFDLLGEEGRRLRADWLSPTPELTVDDGRRAQPLLFAIDYALGKLLESRGLCFSALLGHSVGELAAAALAGVFDLPSAARIMAARSRVLATAPAGGMLAVASAPDMVEGRIPREYADAGVVVGAFNAPQQAILSGPENELLRTEEALRAAGLVARRIRALEPFHSPVLAPLAREFGYAVAAEPLHAPRIPIYSARTGRLVSDAEAVDPTFWAHQMAEPVLYWPALSALLDSGEYVLVESGPGRALSIPARRHPAVRQGRSSLVCLLPPGESGDTPKTWRTGLTQLGLAEDTSRPGRSEPVRQAPPH